MGETERDRSEREAVMRARDKSELEGGRERWSECVCVSDTRCAPAAKAKHTHLFIYFKSHT